MHPVSAWRKVVATAGLFLVAVGIVVVAAATKSGIPLFFAWVPLVGAGWALTRPEPARPSVGRPSPGRADHPSLRPPANEP
jgi:hypothetical protein